MTPTVERSTHHHRLSPACTIMHAQRQIAIVNPGHDLTESHTASNAHTVLSQLAEHLVGSPCRYLAHLLLRRRYPDTAFDESTDPIFRQNKETPSIYSFTTHNSSMLSFPQSRSRHFLSCSENRKYKNKVLRTASLTPLCPHFSFLDSFGRI